MVANFMPDNIRRRTLFGYNGPCLKTVILRSPDEIGATKIRLRRVPTRSSILGEAGKSSTRSENLLPPAQRFFASLTMTVCKRLLRQSRCQAKSSGLAGMWVAPNYRYGMMAGMWGLGDFMRKRSGVYAKRRVKPALAGWRRRPPRCGWRRQFY